MGKLNFEYKDDMAKSLMELKINNISEIIDYQLKMLIHNKSKYLVPMNVKEEDMNLTLQYDITDKMSVKKYLSKNLLDKKDFIYIVGQIIKSFKECKELLLDYHNLFLDMDNIYIKKDGKEISMMYLPLKDLYENNRENLVNIINKLISNINKSEDDISVMISKVVMYVNNDNFNIFKLENMLEEFQNIKEQTQMSVHKIETSENLEKENLVEVNAGIIEKLKTPQGITVQLVFIAIFIGLALWLEEVGVLVQNIDKLIGGLVIGAVIDYFLVDRIIITKQENKIEMDKEIEIEREEETNINEDDKTIVIPNYAYLKSIDGMHEDVIINKERFEIGKIPDKVDFYISNATISRHQAEIVESDGVYGIKDLGSRNGTYVNDEKLENEQTRKLANGDIITFSNESFKFVCKE
ncbi:MAG: hypothetical protein A2Y24_03600 [Clostridiales bacterium GWE2_32_10]|nr:MAG: hypothetical protein A2Y24_03600 [Clostridiales bacterium GWE2_32_10]HBY19496.1 hypothetical protein [Clostridiales bacterium]